MSMTKAKFIRSHDRRNGSNTIIVFDTMTVRQSDVVNLFTEKDVFLSLINPLYFIEKIAEDGREFLQKLVPVVKQEDILTQMSEDEQTLLKHESLLDPEYFIKQRREELKEYEESAVYLEGQRDLLNQQYNDAVAKLDVALKRGNEIAARKSELEKRQFEGINVEALKVKKMKFDSLNTEILRLIHRLRQAGSEDQNHLPRRHPARPAARRLRRTITGALSLRCAQSTMKCAQGAWR